MRSSWGSRFDRFVHNNVEATQRLLEALRADAGHAARLRLVVLDLRRVRAAADARGRAAAAALALRRDQARGRAAVPRLPRQPRARDGGAALLHRLRPAPAPGHGVPALLRGRRRAAARSSCSATAARAATSPTSPTSSARSARPGSAEGAGGRAYNVGGGVAGQPQRGARAAGRDRRPPARRHARRARVGRRAAHRRRHQPRARGARLRARDEPRRRACGRSSSGCSRARSAAPRLAAVSARPG